ncbi:MAG: hypothetical protein ACYCR5_04865 [Leptospirillum sp.]
MENAPHLPMTEEIYAEFSTEEMTSLTGATVKFLKECEWAKPGDLGKIGFFAPESYKDAAPVGPVVAHISTYIERNGVAFEVLVRKASFFSIFQIVEIHGRTRREGGIA